MLPLIHTNIPLADKNWFQTGGPAEYFCEPATPSEFSAALSFARTNSLAITLLGAGANILIADNGIRGLVIRPALKIIELVTSNNGDTIPAISPEHSPEHSQTKLVRAGAGVELDTLLIWCLDHYLLGLEEFAGIPGTVGGAVYINIHYFEYLLSNFLTSATVLDLTTGELQLVNHAWFAFGYNTSRLHDKTHALIDATFALRAATPSETAYARGRHDEIIRHRRARYPASHTCGSFFRNFLPEELTHAPPAADPRYAHIQRVPYVGYYLDLLGLKGTLRVGGAQISHRHANMIVNTGTATSTDIITLARTMQRQVYDAFGLRPEPECQLLGFAKNPLSASFDARY